MNSVQLIGRLTRDPEIRATTDGPVCALRIAVDRMGRGSTVGYVDVSVWGKAGEACKAHLRQGWLVGVSGRLEYREWQAEDGSRRSAHSIVGAVDFLVAPKVADVVGDVEPFGEPAAA